MKALDIRVPAQLIAWLAERRLTLAARVGSDGRTHIVELRTATREIAAKGVHADWEQARIAAMLQVELREGD